MGSCLPSASFAGLRCSGVPISFPFAQKPSKSMRNLECKLSYSYLNPRSKFLTPLPHKTSYTGNHHKPHTNTLEDTAMCGTYAYYIAYCNSCLALAGAMTPNLFMPWQIATLPRNTPQAAELWEQQKPHALDEFLL